MADYMERCRVCGCWTDYSNKATAVCDDCQRAGAVAVRAVQPPDLATLQARITAQTERITTLEALLLEARTALEELRVVVIEDEDTPEIAERLSAALIRAYEAVYGKPGGGQGAK